MRLIMLGTGPFAVPTLQKLAASAHEIALVITRPPAGRNAQPSPLQRAAESLNLEVWSPPTVNAPEAESKISSLAADLLVVCDYGEILRPETLATSRLGGINLHGSLLPQYRGAAPVQWAILNGDAETGNSVIQMTPGLDSGPLLAQQRTPIEPDEDSEQLETRLARIGADAVVRVVAELESGTAQSIAQDKSQASKAPRLTKEQGAIDWSRSASQIKDQIRALRPWPRAYTFWHRSGSEAMRLNIDRVATRSATVPSEEALPAGTIVDASGTVLVTTGAGTIEVLELQPAGKRSMPAAEFIRGYRPMVGDVFGRGGNSS
jgi:methionyl-tRNA formyltransferase